MAKYNITERKEKNAAYRGLVSSRQMDDLEQKITAILIDQKRYRDKRFSAKKLAAELGTNTRYVSAVVNVRFQMNYTSLVNSYRIKEAMQLLRDRRNDDLSMEQISDLVGFSNRQSFYASFFRLNGITPRAYKMHHWDAMRSKGAKRPARRGQKLQTEEQ